MVNFIVFCLSLVAGVVILMNILVRFGLHRDNGMTRKAALGLALGEVGIAVAVRVKRAVDSALWDVCPEFMHWSREVATAANKAVVAAQWGGNPPAPKAKAGARAKAKKELPPAVKPVSELPSSFPSHAARTAAQAKLRAERDRLWEEGHAMARALSGSWDIPVSR